MSVKLASKKDQEVVEDFLRNPEGASVLFGLSVDGHEVETVYEGEWGSDSGGAVYVDLSIGERLPLDLYDAASSFAVRVNGTWVPQMSGVVSFPKISEDTASTEFVAASARAQPIPLGDVTRYPGMTPDDVVRDAFLRLPYSRTHSFIEPLKEPLLYFQEPTANFWPEETAQDVLDRVEKQTPYKIRDNVWGGGVASVSLQPSQVKDYRVYDALDFIKWRPPPLAERRYSHVIVFKRNADGTDAFDPQVAPIEYRGQPPLRGSTLWIELDDDTENASIRARNLAYTYATQLARGVYKDDSIILPTFDPLIEIQDVFWVYETWEDPSGLYDRQWMCWVDTYKHDYETLNTEVSHSATLMAVEKIRVPDFAMPGHSGGVGRTIFGPCEEIGDLLRLRDEDLDWAEVDGDLVHIAEDAPEVYIPEVVGLYPSESLYPSETLYPSGDEAELITITCPAIESTPLWGELLPNLIRFDASVPWVTQSGDLLVIDTVGSGSNATENGDLVTIS